MMMMLIMRFEVKRRMDTRAGRARRSECERVKGEREKGERRSQTERQERQGVGGYLYDCM